MYDDIGSNLWNEGLTRAWDNYQTQAKESGMAYRKGPWGVSELHEALDAFEAQLKEAGLAQNTIRTYVDRSRNFVRWLDGDYEPRGPDQ